MQTEIRRRAIRKGRRDLVFVRSIMTLCLFDNLVTSVLVFFHFTWIDGYTFVKLGAHVTHSQRAKAWCKQVFTCLLVVKWPGYSLTSLLTFDTKICSLEFFQNACGWRPVLWKSITGYPCWAPTPITPSQVSCSRSASASLSVVQRSMWLAKSVLWHVKEDELCLLSQRQNHKTRMDTVTVRQQTLAMFLSVHSTSWTAFTTCPCMQQDLLDCWWRMCSSKWA